MAAKFIPLFSTVFQTKMKSDAKACYDPVKMCLTICACFYILIDYNTEIT